MDRTDVYLGWHVSDSAPAMRNGLQRFFDSPIPDTSTYSINACDGDLIACDDTSDAEEHYQVLAPLGLSNDSQQGGKRWNICSVNALVQCQRVTLDEPRMSSTY